ncbi:death domain-containing protein [Phthorimaea operculella]|nr:death domain-containing protein [Phthorimaea operculella]
MFRGEINSLRRLEKITTINQLLVVLELRDALSEDNVTPLKQIAQLLYNDELVARISQYESTHVPKELRNHYVPQQLQAPQHAPAPAPAIQSINPFGQISPRKGQRILEKVTEEIGKNWMDLGRNLRLREKTINDVEKKYRSFQSKATELLNIYFKKEANPDRWFFDLCEALDKTRRHDLTKSISEILTMNI